MQKLIIKEQFMGVKPCTIEFNKFLLLIGEQASGKSTIAKLIYFFQTIPDSLYDNAIITRSKSMSFDYVAHINQIIRQKFLETFGPTSRGPRFEIEFFYDNHTSWKIFQAPKNGFTFSEAKDDIKDKIATAFRKYINSPRLEDIETDEITFRQQFRQDLDKIFIRKTNASTYLIAGISTLVAFPDIFENVIEKQFEKLLEDEVKEQDFEKRQRTGNEKLMYDFVKWSKSVRNNFKNNGRNFQSFGLALNNRPSTEKIRKITEIILKGIYQSTEFGEQIKLPNNNLPVAMKDASSGQQEVIRILQGLFLSVGLSNRKEFFVVEEPEAHLYPLAQKELINAFAVFINTIKEGRLIITTHSPYILACVNILLFAHYVSIKTDEPGTVTANVPREYWLDSAIFNAYSLGQSESYCIDIKNPETGLIDQNYLDTISEQLGMQQHELYNLLVETV
jgi:predicted ATP-dependent endonuclease of OLD family